MTRLLLALVALLTGLAVQSSPAAARICVGTEVGVMQVERSEGAATARASLSGIPLARQVSGARAPDCAVAKTKPVYIPSVQLGIDVAHE